MSYFRQIALNRLFYEGFFLIQNVTVLFKRTLASVVNRFIFVMSTQKFINLVVKMSVLFESLFFVDFGGISLFSMLTAGNKFLISFICTNTN